MTYVKICTLIVFSLFAGLASFWFFGKTYTGLIPWLFLGSVAAWTWLLFIGFIIKSIDNMEKMK